MPGPHPALHFLHFLSQASRLQSEMCVVSEHLSVKGACERLAASRPKVAREFLEGCWTFGERTIEVRGHQAAVCSLCVLGLGCCGSAFPKPGHVKRARRGAVGATCAFGEFGLSCYISQYSLMSHVSNEREITIPPKKLHARSPFCPQHPKLTPAHAPLRSFH